ncbi:MAG: DNRLRE domain-containing protein [Planctomycetota bacterium]
MLHLLCSVASAAAAVIAPAQDAFSVIALPDTQYYSESAALAPIFIAQTQWVVDHLVSDRIAFVTHLGDIVDSGAQGANQNLFEWNNADTAMRRLDGDLGTNPEGNVPYSAVIGNHDYAVVSSKASGGARYRDFFGPSRYAGRSWYLGASLDGLCHAQRFDTPEGPWLHLGLEWHPSDMALAFAQRKIAEHPGLPVIVATHEHLGPGSRAAWQAPGATPDMSGDNDGQQVFRKLCEPNPEVVLVLCGHINGNGRRSDATVFGREGHQVLADFQFDPNGGNGWMLRIGFDVQQQRIRVRTFSPTYVLGSSPGLDRSTDPLANFDLPYDARAHRAELEGATLLRFRHGQDFGSGPWLGGRDAYIGNGAQGDTLPSASYGAAPEVRCDGDADREQGLLAFDGLIGAGAQQVPAGATIHRAVLTLTTEGAAADSGSGGTLHRMLAPWSEASTWDALVGGVQLGSEASTVIDVNTRGFVDEKGTRSFDVTAAVQAWANGQPNHGWLVLAGGTDRWSFRAREWGEVMERPLLTVQFTPPCPAPVRFCPALANSTGNVGLLQVQGTPSVTANDLELVASGLPSGALALFIAGPARAQFPVGDGVFCVGGGVLRLPPPISVDLLGQAFLPLDLAQAPLAGAVQAGTAWTFQCWHRDSTPGGSNLTDAVEVHLCD